MSALLDCAPNSRRFIIKLRKMMMGLLLAETELVLVETFGVVVATIEVASVEVASVEVARLEVELSAPDTFKVGTGFSAFTLKLIGMRTRVKTNKNPKVFLIYVFYQTTILSRFFPSKPGLAH